MAQRKKITFFGLKYPTNSIQFLSSSRKMLWHYMHDRSNLVFVGRLENNWSKLFRFFSSTTSFTRHKTALITIKNFKLIFTRVPLGTPRKMSDEPSLAIECLSFSILGSSGEDIFGNPKPITVHPDLYQWSEGLKRDGGAGCVLSMGLLC